MQMKNFGYLFAGLASFWAVAFVYLWRLARETSRLQEQLASIEQRLRDR